VTRRDPALDAAGFTRHLTCPPPPRDVPELDRKRRARQMDAAARAEAKRLVPTPADACDVDGECSKDEPPRRYPGQGSYCGRHARMMIPEVQWERRGVPGRPKPAKAAKAGPGAEPATLDNQEAEAG
jgi:hypothetical protein